MDLRSRLAQRLDRLESHLAFVVSLHLFVENLVDDLIRAKSETAAAILDDHRAYSFSVKLTLVFNMKLIPKGLFHNVRTLNDLRNRYAHHIDVDLASEFETKVAQALVDRDGRRAFDQAKTKAAEIAADPAAGMQALRVLRQFTFDWLHDECVAAGATR